MNLPNPHCFTRSISRRRAARVATALVLITVLFAVTSVQAGPVTINQVVQTLSPNQGPANLVVSQDPTKGSTPANAPKSDGPTTPTSGDAPKGGLLSSITVGQDPQQFGVEVVEEAEVEGTICDCGDLLIPVGGIPKWPFLFLAAVPLIFIHQHDCESCNDTPSSTPTPTPTPNSTPTPTPEPASLLLFGTGLLAVGAGLRRRYAKAKE